MKRGFFAHRMVTAVLIALAFHSSGSRLNAQSDDLVTAAKRGDLAAITTLLKTGVDVNGRKTGAFGDTTALMEAAERGYPAVVQALLAAKADVNATRGEKKDGETALTLAVQKGHVAIVQALLAAGADVNAHCCLANAVYATTNAGNVDMLKVLLTAKPDLNRVNRISGETALIRAISSGRWEMAQLLVEAGANVNLWTKAGTTPLSLAIRQNGPRTLPLVQTLLAAQADVNLRNCSTSDRTAATPLFWATSSGRVDVVQALLAAKADPNLKQCGGNSPLTIASANGYTEVVRLLLTAKADPEVVEADGKTPLTIAVENSHQDVAELLRSAIATPRQE